MIKTGSDFSGVGAFDQALIRLGIKYKTVFACDMDKYARQTYIENYGQPDYFPENVYDREIPKEPLDIYMTSPPCQAFSLAGKRKGENDKRGVLFYNSHEFIIKNKPRYFIFENVKGLLSDNHGKTFRIWLDYLGKSVNGNPIIFPLKESAGYHIYYKVLNSKDFGVPQNRERVFIVGIRDNKDNYFRFPKEEHLKLKLKDVLEDEVKDKYYLSESAINSIINNKDNIQKSKINPSIAKALQSPGNACGVYKGANYIKTHSLYPRSSTTGKGGTGHLTKEDGTSYCIDTGNSQAIELKRLEDLKLIATKRIYETPKEINEFLRKHKNTSIKEIADKLNIPKTQAEHYFRTDKFRTIPSVEIWNKLKDLLNFNSKYDKQVCEIEQSEYTFESAVRLYSDKGLGATLQTTENTLYQTKNTIRRLTPRECFRLQDFPDSFTWSCSDSQAYKQAGNSITVGVLAKIIDKLNL